MQYKRFSKNAFTVVIKLIRYNLKIIFANKFIYFLMAALFIFLLVTGIYLMNADAQMTEANVFWLLLVPGILLVFYPITFGIQNDADNRMLEIIFGIPNYRYKVLLLRLMLVFTVTFAILVLISLFSTFALIAISMTNMLYHLMFPIVFLGSMAFMVSTVIRDGSGTAVVMIIIGIIFLIGRGFFQEYPQCDIFLNPFEIPQNINEIAWAEIVADNRLYLCAGSIVAVLFGLLNLQKREKFL